MKRSILLFLVLGLLGGCFDNDAEQNSHNSSDLEEVVVYSNLEHELPNEMLESRNFSFNENDYRQASNNPQELLWQLGALEMFTMSDYANEDLLYDIYMEVEARVETTRIDEKKFQQHRERLEQLSQETYDENHDEHMEEIDNVETDEYYQDPRYGKTQYELEDHKKSTLPKVYQLLQNANTKFIVPIVYDEDERYREKMKELGLYLGIRDDGYNQEHELGSNLFTIKIQGGTCNMVRSHCSETKRLTMPFAMYSNVQRYNTMHFVDVGMFLFPFNGITVANEQEARELDKLFHSRKVYWQGRAFIDFVKTNEYNSRFTRNIEHLKGRPSFNLPIHYTALEVQFFNKETGQPITNKRLLLPHQGENTETFQYIPQ